ncbi:effector-associated domain EAD1-containing protein [Catenuloplanes japonicus]|uniref:effector-associated domain EAD1-containing protein n=1 Tax=Catenuloplanes japonicus TaxID=33876 RepID=UPI0005276461|nr:effector-associated domain EAD1-containing protein [Catenuloplanes japonicus]
MTHPHQAPRHLDARPELRTVDLDEALADACRTPQDILDLAATLRIDMDDVRGGDLLQRLLARARRAGKVRALLKAAHDRWPDRDDIAWLHASMPGGFASRSR